MKSMLPELLAITLPFLHFVVGKSVIKIGTVAGDMTQFAEISNIIIRNSQITDNEEIYSAFC